MLRFIHKENHSEANHNQITKNMIRLCEIITYLRDLHFGW